MLKLALARHRRVPDVESSGRSKPRRRPPWKGAFVGAGVGLMVVTNPLPAAAAEYGMWTTTHDVPTAQLCFFTQALARVPSNAPGWMLDYNVAAEKDMRSMTTGCADKQQLFWSHYGYREGIVRATLTKLVDGTICDLFNSTFVAEGAHQWAAGKAYNAKGSCAGNRYWMDIAYQAIGPFYEYRSTITYFDSQSN